MEKGLKIFLKEGGGIKEGGDYLKGEAINNPLRTVIKLAKRRTISVCPLTHNYIQGLEELYWDGMEGEGGD